MLSTVKNRLYVLLIGDPAKGLVQSTLSMCRRLGTDPRLTFSNISQLRIAYPQFYCEPSFSEEEPPIILADIELPGLTQIIGRALPPVILFREKQQFPAAPPPDAFAIIESDFSPEAFSSILQTASRHTTLLQSFIRERMNGREIINNLNDVVYTIDLKGNVVYISSAAERYGFFPRNIIGKSVFDLIDREDHDYLRQQMNKLISERQATSLLRVTDAEGKTRQVRTSSRIVTQHGMPFSITGLLTDQTEQSFREQQILKLTQAVEQSANVIVITDLEGNMEFVNRAFERSTGYSRQEAIGQNPRILKTDYLSEEVYKNLWETINSGNVWEGKFHNKRKDGSTYWEKALISPIKNDAGTIINFVAVKEDITKELAYQQELEQAKEVAEEASRLKSEFLANMSHEIRTPLNVILGFTDLLLDETKDAKKRDHLHLIKDSGKNLLELLNDILDFSKIEANKLDLEIDTFDPKALLQNIKGMFSLEAKRKGLDFTVEHDTPLPELLGDQYRIRQILMNLLSNAMKFTEVGSVSLRAHYENTGIMRFSVSDTGIGIPEESRKQIFHPFEQLDGSAKRKFSGTGLGLSITRRLVHLMGGNVTLESKAGTGSTFTIELPLPTIAKTSAIHGPSPRQDSVGEDQRAHASSSSPKTILVAEDNGLNQELMKLLIRSMGHHCIVVGNGREAITLLEKEKFDLLLLDMHMPVMDGLETIENIRKSPALSDLPVIALTASAMKGDEERFIEAGCNGYLSKPIDRKLLAKMIERID